MTRLLLTLLAFLTGLAVHNAPAEARACGVNGAEVGARAAPLAAGRNAAQARLDSGPKTRRDAPGVERGCGMPPRLTVYLPSVRLGPDRARE